MSRQDATDLLMGEREGGVFLVRDSATIQVCSSTMLRVIEKVIKKTMMMMGLVFWDWF